MKAEKTREALNDCGSCGASSQDCAICFDNGQYSLAKRIDDELAELERLAEIGRYTEMALGDSGDYFLHGYQTDRTIYTISALIKGGKEQKNG